MKERLRVKPYVSLYVLNRLLCTEDGEREEEREDGWMIGIWCKWCDFEEKFQGTVEKWWNSNTHSWPFLRWVIRLALGQEEVVCYSCVSEFAGADERHCTWVELFHCSSWRSRNDTVIGWGFGNMRNCTCAFAQCGLHFFNALPLFTVLRILSGSFNVHSGLLRNKVPYMPRAEEVFR